MTDDVPSETEGKPDDQAPDVEPTSSDGDASQTAEDRSSELEPDVSEPSAPSEPEVDPAKEERGRSSAQSRIRSLTAKRRQAERSAADALKRAERAEERLKLYEDGQSAKEPADDQSADRPVEKALKQERARDAEDARAEADRARASALDAAYDEYTERAADFAETVPDYHETVEAPSTLFSDAMAQELLTSEEGPRTAYFLAKNPKELRRIARLTDPKQVAREIGRIEGRLTRPEPRRVSAAPEPVPAVATGAGGPSGDDPARMSVSELQSLFRKAGVLA